jgi:hypothetical protein
MGGRRAKFYPRLLDVIDFYISKVRVLSGLMSQKLMSVQNDPRRRQACMA